MEVPKPTLEHDWLAKLVGLLFRQVATILQQGNHVEVMPHGVRLDDFADDLLHNITRHIETLDCLLSEDFSGMGGRHGDSVLGVLQVSQGKVCLYCECRHKAKDYHASVN